MAEPTSAPSTHDFAYSGRLTDFATEGFKSRLELAARRLFANERILWLLAAVFGVRMIFLSLLAPDRPDARNFVTAGHDMLFDRGHLYVLAARALATTGTLPVPGKGFLYPAAAAALAAPFAVLPSRLAVSTWTLADAVAVLAALVVLYRTVKPEGLQRPLFWLLAAYFPPLFAEVDAGQIGGFILLLAACSISFARTRPALAGLLAGLAGSIKVYPAAMALGAGPRLRYWAGVVGASLAATIATFVPLGWSGAAFYVQQVFLPATVKAKFQDCAIDSVKTFYARTVGGETYYLPANHGLTPVALPLHLPWLASALSIATVLALVAACVWGSRRSGWNPVFGLSAGFGLGALVPAEVNPYQFLPLLPLALLTLTTALQARRHWVAVALAVTLLAFVRQPCDLPFPNLWTLGGVAMYLLCISQAALFLGWRRGDVSEPGRPVHVGRSRHVART